MMGWLSDDEKVDTDDMADLAGGTAQKMMPCNLKSAAVRRMINDAMPLV